MPFKTLSGCPCLTCEKLDQCLTGGQYDPAVCMDLTKWMEDNTKEFPCPVCGKVLPTERGMKIHLTKMHNKEKRGS